MAAVRALHVYPRTTGGRGVNARKCAAVYRNRKLETSQKGKKQTNKRNTFLRIPAPTQQYYTLIDASLCITEKCSRLKDSVVKGATNCNHIL